MESSHRTAMTYTLRPRGFWGVLLESNTTRYITVAKGVVRCEKLATIYTIHDLSIVIKQIKSRHFFAHRQKCRDISSMPTADRYELAISVPKKTYRERLQDYNK